MSAVRAEADSIVYSDHMKKAKANSSRNTTDAHDSSSSSSSSDNHDYSAQRTQEYVADSRNPNPEYQHYTSDASIRAHAMSMNAYLEGFDLEMMGYNHNEEDP